MEGIHEQYELEAVKFEKPDSVVTAKICTKSGKLAVEGLCDKYAGGSTIRTEYFAKGTVPSDLCDVHVRLKLCEESKKIANDYCPQDKVKDTVYLVKNEDYSAKTRDTEFILPESTETCDIHTPLTDFFDNIIPSPTPSPANGNEVEQPANSTGTD